MKHKPIDATGKRIQTRDTVRIIGIPDLTGMAPECRSESLPVFEYLVGKYKVVQEFDEHGFAWLRFNIAKGPHRGWHSVAVEPYLLKVRSSNRKASNAAIKRARNKRRAA